MAPSIMAIRFSRIFRSGCCAVVISPTMPSGLSDSWLGNEAGTTLRRQKRNYLALRPEPPHGRRNAYSYDSDGKKGPAGQGGALEVFGEGDLAGDAHLVGRY